MFVIPKISPEYFTWHRWYGGSTTRMHVQCRYIDITSSRGKKILRKYAVGWCKGTNLHCRPKTGNVGVMFFIDGEHFWCHLLQKEFDEVFQCDSEK